MPIGPSLHRGALPPLDDVACGALQWAVLLIVFDGDAAAWASYLAENGSPAQRRDDLPLARIVARNCARDESLRLRLRLLARQLQPRPH